MKGLVVDFAVVRGAVLMPFWDQWMMFVTREGNISYCGAIQKEEHVFGVQWGNPEGIVVAADGTIFVTELGGNILKAKFAEPCVSNCPRDYSVILANGLKEPHQLVLSADGATLFVVEGGSNGQLLRINLLSGRQDVVATGLEKPIGLALSPDGATAYVTEQADSGGRLTRVEIDTGKKNVLLKELTFPSFLSWADRLPDGKGGTLGSGTHLLITESSPANRVSVINLTGVMPVRQTVETLSFSPSSTVPLGDRIYVFGDGKLAELDVNAGLYPKLHLNMPEGPLFIGGWARIGVEVGGTLSFDDLVFEVEGQPVYGMISPSRDDTFNLNDPSIMLLAGSMTGTFYLRAIKRDTEEVLEKKVFEVTTEWQNEQLGPAVQFVGKSSFFVTGAENNTWGAGFTGAQNVDVLPAHGTKRVAIILVDTTSSQYPSNTTTICNEWQNEFIGVKDPDGVVRGVWQYFDEVSYGRFNVDL